MVEQIEQSRAQHQSATEPLFFYHPGDVVYFNGISRDYPVQFYEPYQKYDAPIVAIPGNHDGDTRTRSGDRAAQTAGRMPNLVLSGHVHNYQRFTRKINNRKVTYVVAGAGGYANSLRAMHKVAPNPDTKKPIKTPLVTARPGVTFETYNDTEPGFLRLTVKKKNIVGEYFTVDFTGAAKGVRDKFTVNL